jgi:hypothetical protein
MIKEMLLRYAAWLIRNAEAKLYSWGAPVGTRLGGKDIPELPDKYIILDVRVANRIIILGYFQTT